MGFFWTGQYYPLERTQYYLHAASKCAERSVGLL